MSNIKTVEKIVLKYLKPDPDYEGMAYVGKHTRCDITEAVDFASVPIAENHANFVYMKVKPVTIKITYEEIL